MQPQQQETAIIGGPGVPQPYVISTTPTRPFSHRQAKAIGVLLIIVGCLSILFNTVDLAVGTGLPNNIYGIYQPVRYDSYYRYDTYYSGYVKEGYYSRDDEENPNSLSSGSFGVAGHGFWCGIMVSQLTLTFSLPSQYRLIIFFIARKSTNGGPRICEERRG